MKHYYLLKLRAVLLLFALFCSVSSVWAEKHYVVGDSGPMWEYDESTKTLTISGEGHVGYTGPTPWGSLEIVNVIIESGITSIGGYMFSEHADLVSVSIPNTVTTIGAGAFYHCTSLPSIYLPDNIEDIGEYAFSGCMNLASANIPANLKIINTQLFSGCKLQSITIPEGVTEIKYYAFWGCDLTSVTIPASVIEIGPNPFANCEYLTSIIVNSGNTYYDSRDNCNAIIEKSKNKLISGCSTTVIPNGVTIIGSSAWFGMNQLSSITIPEGVDSIMGEAFRYCSNLKSVVFPSTLRSICSLAFSNCAAISDILCYATPNGFIWEFSTLNDPAFKPNKGTICHVNNKDAWETAFPNVNVTFSEGIPHFISGDSGLMWKYNGTSKELTICGEGDMPSFESTDSPWKNADIETITIAEGVTSIGDYAFKNTSVEAVTISSTVATIGAHAFESCTSLASINIPEGVATIRAYAFKDCSSLETVTLPNSLTTIESGAFVGCVATEDVYCYANPANLTWTDSNIGFKASKATNFHVENATAWTESYPDANVIYIQDIGKHYISGNSGPMWEYNGISKELTISGEGEMPSFESTDSPWKDVNIETITIEEGVTCIGDYAFKNTSVEAVTISSTVATIGAHAFESCTSLASINIPEGVATTRAYAFKDCSALETVTLPNSLTTIETGAFVGCVATEDVYCYANPANLTWTDNNTCFKPSKATYFHVNNSNAWISAYPDANITYVQDIANDWTSKQYISGTSGPMWRYSATLNTLEISGTGDIPDFTSSTYPWDSYVNNIYSILIKDGVTSIGAKAFENCYYTQSFIIGNDVTSIGENSIPESEITSIYIPQNVSNISINAFCNRYYLSTITVDSRNTHYDSRNNCNAIITKDNVLFLGSKNTIIPEDVVAIGDHAFYGSSIERCVIPNNVTTIGEYAFAWSKLKSIVINGVETIKQYAFSYPDHLSVITLPSSLTKIENYAFEGCYAAKEIYCYANPDNLTWEGYNGNYCFKKLNYNNTPNFHVADASAWESKFSGANTNWIGDLEGEWTTYKYISGESGAMWQYNPILKTLRIGGTGDMPELGEYSTPWLNLRGAIDNAIINDGVTSIGKNSFFRCESLNSIIIPSSVINIGESAFSGCISLASATLYSPSLPTYATNVFKNNAANRKIYVLSDCVNTYQMGWSSYVGDILPISLGMNANPQKTADKWCTYFNSSTNVTVPSGTTIYKAQLDQVNNKVMLTEVEGSVVAKGNAVMLKSSTDNIALSSATTSDLGTYSDNDLKGGDVTSGYIAYTLAGINGIMGFYRFTGNSLDPNKAHLEVANSNPNSAPQLIPFDNGTTEIMLNTVKTAEDKGEWYSLDGRQIQGKPTQKGIYVKKGKKYVVK